MRKALFILLVLGAVYASISTAVEHNQKTISTKEIETPIVPDRIAPATKKPDLIPNLVEQEAKKMDLLTDSGEQEKNRLDQIAAALSSQDAEDLGRIAIEKQHTHNERFFALYLLSVRPKDFLPILTKIAESEAPVMSSFPRPHKMAEEEKKFEIALRISAMAAIGTLSPVSTETKQVFAEIEKNNSVPELRHVAGIGRVGAEHGTDSLNQYIEAKNQSATGIVND